MKKAFFMIAVALALCLIMCKSGSNKKTEQTAVAESSMDQPIGIEYNVESMRSALDTRIVLCSTKSSLIMAPKKPVQQPKGIEDDILALPASYPVRQNGPPE